MLPTFDATMTSRGVFIHRPDRGKKAEFLIGCRFVNDHLIQSGMLAVARKHGIHVRLNMDPNDLKVAWLPTSDGVQRLNNVYADDLLVARGSINELCVIQDGDALVRLKDKARQDQDDLDFINRRESINRSAIEQRDRERAVAESGCPATPVQDSSAQTPRERRETEIDLLKRRGLASPIDINPPAPPAEDAESVAKAPINDIRRTKRETPSLNDDTLAAIRNFKQRSRS